MNIPHVEKQVFLDLVRDVRSSFGFALAHFLWTDELSLQSGQSPAWQHHNTELSNYLQAGAARVFISYFNLLTRHWYLTGNYFLCTDNLWIYVSKVLPQLFPFLFYC